MIDNISLGRAFRTTAFITAIMSLLAVAMTRDRYSSDLRPMIGFDTKLPFRYDVFLLLGLAFTSILGYTSNRFVQIKCGRHLSIS
jgi:hypothetical protein